MKHSKCNKINNFKISDKGFYSLSFLGAKSKKLVNVGMKNKKIPPKEMDALVKMHNFFYFPLC